MYEWAKRQGPSFVSKLASLDQIQQEQARCRLEAEYALRDPELDVWYRHRNLYMLPDWAISQRHGISAEVGDLLVMGGRYPQGSICCCGLI